MKFQELVQRLCGNHTEPFVELGQKNIVRLRSNDEGMLIYYAVEKPDELSSIALELLKQTARKSFLLQLDTLLWAKILGNGPKIFRPTLYQLSMLEKMTLNLSTAEFATPFETIVVELPEGYADTIEGFKPAIAVLHYDKATNFIVHSLATTEHVVKSFWAPKGEEQLELWFDDSDQYYEDFASRSDIPVTKTETMIETRVRRAVMNYCLLLDEVGIKKHGPATPNAYAQLVKWCQKNNKHTAKNKMGLVAQPIVYGIARDTKLVRIIDNTTDLPSDPTGRKVSPHWRRGHYRMQPCGPGRSERKRIRIPPIMVNKGSLLTKVYTT